MLRMTVIILIGILIASGNEDYKSIETTNDLLNRTKLENSKIVMIKIKPDLPSSFRTSEPHDKAESRNAKDSNLIFVEVRTDETPDSTIDQDLSDIPTEFNTRRFLSEQDLDIENNALEIAEESRTSDHEPSTDTERTADNYQNEHNYRSEDSQEAYYSNQEIPSLIGREASKDQYEQNSSAESNSAEMETNDRNADYPENSMVSQRFGETTETPTRRKLHYNSSVLNNIEINEEPENPGHKVEIEPQRSEIIEQEDIEPYKNTRRNFNDNYYPDFKNFEDDRIETAKSRKNFHDIVLDTRARSGMPQEEFDIPGHTYYYSEPYSTNGYQNPKPVDFQANKPKVNGLQLQNTPVGYQPYTKNYGSDPDRNPIADYQLKNIPIAYQLHEQKNIGSPQQPRNQKAYHPVYGNYLNQNNAPQNFQPNSPRIPSRPIQMAPEPEIQKPLCRTGGCFSLPLFGNLESTILYPQRFAYGNIFIPGLNAGLDLNANFGFSRSLIPQRQNNRFMNPYHTINARSKINEKRDTHFDDEDNYDEDENSNNYNNYPNANRNSDDGLNTYHYETTGNYPHQPQTSDHNSYRPQKIEDYSDEYKSFDSTEYKRSDYINKPISSRSGNNSPMMYFDENPNLSVEEIDNYNIYRRISNNHVEPGLVDVKDYKPKNVFDFIGLNNGLYDFRSPNYFKPQNNRDFDPRGSNYDRYDRQGRNSNPRNPINNRRGFYNEINTPTGLGNNPYESVIRPHLLMKPTTMFKNFLIG